MRLFRLSAFVFTLLLLLWTALVQGGQSYSHDAWFFFTTSLFILFAWRFSLSVDHATAPQPKGLLERTVFIKTVQQILSIEKHHQYQCALIKIELEKFQKVHTSAGLQVADKILAEIHHRILHHMHDWDVGSQINADEFIVLFTELSSRSQLESRVALLQTELNTLYTVKDKEYVIPVSMGVAVFPADADEVDDLLKAAAQANLHARKNGSGECVYYDAGLETASRKLFDVSDLVQALRNNEYRLYFQPKVDAATGRIKGMEALLRWLHPQRGMISPVDFIPLLEESGLIIDVGAWVLQEACRINKQWQDQGFAPLCVSVNVSGIQFNKPGFIDRLKQIIEQSGLEAKYVEIELTESCLMSDVQSSIKLLSDIRNLGIQISVDDFGTGYSSLSYLQRFPINTLKIDRSFIKNVHDRRTSDNASIVTAIMALSHSLRLNVVAEGVETARELSYLHALGCKTIQGFLFSKPLSEQEFTELLQDDLRMKQVIEKVRAELALPQ